jgi:hypothetical protein
MRNQDQLEADFVRRLMVDIFDNPVKRLYRQKGEDSDTDECAELLASVCGKISPEKVKLILETLQKLCVQA